MYTYPTPKPLSAEASILYNGKWRLVRARGNYVKGEEPRIQFVTLLATGEDIEAKLNSDQRTAVMKELIAAAKRDSDVFRPWADNRRR